MNSTPFCQFAADPKRSVRGFWAVLKPKKVTNSQKRGNFAAWKPFVLFFQGPGRGWLCCSTKMRRPELFIAAAAVYWSAIDKCWLRLIASRKLSCNYLNSIFETLIVQLVTKWATLQSVNITVVSFGCWNDFSRGCSLTKILTRIFQNPKKIQEFFWGFKICVPYLGVNNFSISVFKSFLFIKFS